MNIYSLFSHVVIYCHQISEIGFKEQHESRYIPQNFFLNSYFVRSERWPSTVFSFQALSYYQISLELLQLVVQGIFVLPHYMTQVFQFSYFNYELIFFPYFHSQRT